MITKKEVKPVRARSESALAVQLTKIIKKTHRKGNEGLESYSAALCDEGVTLSGELIHTSLGINQEQLARCLSSALRMSGIEGWVEGSTVTLFRNPAREWNLLVRVLSKMGAGVPDYRQYYTIEEGKRRYLCHDSEKCGRVVEFIRKNRTTRDILSFTNSDNRMSISVTTPKGKVKGEYMAKA